MRALRDQTLRGIPLRKVHELAFLWFGLPGPLLTKIPYEFLDHCTQSIESLENAQRKRKSSSKKGLEGQGTARDAARPLSSSRALRDHTLRIASARFRAKKRIWLHFLDAEGFFFAGMFG